MCRDVLENANELRIMLCREKRSGTRTGTSVIAACGEEPDCMRCNRIHVHSSPYDCVSKATSLCQGSVEQIISCLLASTLAGSVGDSETQR